MSVSECVRERLKMNDTNMQADDINILWKPSYVQIMVEGEEEEMNEQHWETTCGCKSSKSHNVEKGQWLYIF